MYFPQLYLVRIMGYDMSMDRCQYAFHAVTSRFPLSGKCQVHWTALTLLLISLQKSELRFEDNCFSHIALLFSFKSCKRYMTPSLPLPLVFIIFNYFSEYKNIYKIKMRYEHDLTDPFYKNISRNDQPFKIGLLEMLLK